MRSLLIIAVPVLLLGCALTPDQEQEQPPTQPALETVKLRPPIEAANRQLMDAYNRGDKAAVARMYEDNALMISDRGERYQGREAIDKYWNPPPKPGAKPGKWTLEIISLEGTERMPIQRGRSILEFPTESKPIVSDVEFVVIWRRQADDSYKIAVDAWWPTGK